ncbi:MerR family transcriptional regulator [Amycolatopsis acididurans]|uniref:MerR family transcriptional regulator n=1 Tax=Amycolatopsis acididurans TaxID=2724524 RepID=UPI0028AFB36E|nr:MerR family transcriptional regulator [Amycolatopsis acididurans]
MKSRKSVLRTVDVARGAGYSVQQVRDLERAGVLPPAARTESGYRVYAEEHLCAAFAYRAFAKGLGPVEARNLMRAAHRAPAADVLARLDAAHANLHAERQELALAKHAASLIAGEPVSDTRPSDSMSISELADALGIRPSTLRHWDAEGLVVPGRTGNARTYSPEAVRDARIVHQLRLAGYRIEPLRALLPRLRAGRRWEEVLTALAARDADLTTRSRALLDGAAALAGVLDQPR